MTSKQAPVKNYDADSAGMTGSAASAEEATGLFARPARGEHEAEFAEEVFPLASPPGPDGDPDAPDEKRKHIPGTVHPIGDEKPHIPNTITDSEFGLIDRREPVPGYFSKLGMIDPADDFVRIEDPVKH